MIEMFTEKLSHRGWGYAPNTSPRNSDTILIRVATTTDELEDIYSFRYETYLEERELPQFYADHSSRRITDPLDRGARNIVAYQGNDVVGVLRVNCARESDIAYYADFLEMNSAGIFHPNSTSISTRLLVSPRLRGSSLAVRLSQAAFSLGVQFGIRYNFLDCDHRMTRFFERLGYVFQRRAEHPEYGVGNVMRLDLRDRLHLAHVGSPFLAILDAATL